MTERKRISRVAIGLTVQGGLEMLLGVAVLVAASERDTPVPATQYEVLVQRFGPAVLIAGGALKALAGRMNRNFRGRRIGLAALWSAVATTALVWHCAPTGLALFAYGIVVYRDPSVRRVLALDTAGSLPPK